jgi:hypothetical protein
VAQAGGHKGEGADTDKGIEEAQNHLLGQIGKRGSSAVRPWAGIALGVFGQLLLDTQQGDLATVTGALRTSLDDEKNPDRVGAYALALGMVHDQGSLTVLREKLTSIRQDEARGYIALGLGMMGSKEVIEEIQNIVRDSKYRPELLRQAAIALGLLGDKDLVPELVTMLQEAKGLATQAAISSALGFIGDSRSIDPLVQMLENQDLTGTARGFAAVALGIVADKENLPWNSKISRNINYRATTATLNDTQGTGILNIL